MRFDTLSLYPVGTPKAPATPDSNRTTPTVTGARAMSGVDATAVAQERSGTEPIEPAECVWQMALSVHSSPPAARARRRHNLRRQRKPNLQAALERELARSRGGIDSGPRPVRPAPPLTIPSLSGYTKSLLTDLLLASVQASRCNASLKSRALQRLSAPQPLAVPRGHGLARRAPHATPFAAGRALAPAVGAVGAATGAAAERAASTACGEVEAFNNQALPYRWLPGLPVRPMPTATLLNASRLEVMHLSDGWDGPLWLYAAPGSGVWWRPGRRLVARNLVAAVLALHPMDRVVRHLDSLMVPPVSARGEARGSARRVEELVRRGLLEKKTSLMMEALKWRAAFGGVHVPWETILRAAADGRDGYVLLAMAGMLFADLLTPPFPSHGGRSGAGSGYDSIVLLEQSTQHMCWSSNPALSLSVD